MSFDAEDSTPEEAATLSPAQVFPWPPAGASPIQSFVDTWKEATFHPSAFFASMPEEEPLGPSLLYLVILCILAAGIGLFWTMVFPRAAVESSTMPNPMSVLNSITPMVGFLLYPLIKIIAVFFGAAITQLMLLILVPQRGSYTRTVRVYCFAYSPALFAVIPIIGTFVGAIWVFVISIIGLREAHRTTTARAIAVVLLPTILFAILMIILVMIAIGGAFMMVK